MPSDAFVEFARGCSRAIAGVIAIAVAPLWLVSATGGKARAEPRDNTAVGAIGLVSRGGPAGEAPVHTAPPKDGAESPVELSFRAGLASDYIYRGTTLSDRKPAVGAAIEAAFSVFYAAATVASVKLPTQPAAEITMTGGIRPTVGDVSFDLGWTYFLYPGEIAPVGGSAGIEYWEALARADTKIGDLLACGRRLCVFTECLEHRRVEQIRGVRPGHRPAERRAAAECHRVADRRRRVFLVRQSVGRARRFSVARLSQLECGRDLYPQPAQPRSALLRHQSVEGRLLRLHG